VNSFQDFGHHVALICNNAVEFNGEDSDYGIYASELLEYRFVLA
jgi:hypothetical protein